MKWQGNANAVFEGMLLHFETRTLDLVGGIANHALSVTKNIRSTRTLAQPIHPSGLSYGPPADFDQKDGAEKKLVDDLPIDPL